MFEIEDKSGVKPSQFIVSVFLLGTLLSFFYSFCGNPSEGESYKVLAGTKALDTGKSLFLSQDLLPILFIYFPSKIGLGFVNSYYIIASLFFSLYLHIVFLLFENRRWKTNQYLVIYLAGFFPFVNKIPLLFFSESIAIVILLWALQMIHLETLSNLVLLVFSVLGAFLASMSFFISGGFLFFVVLACLKMMQKQKGKTMVFYKKKNIPMIVMAVSFFLWILSIWILSFTDFLGQGTLTAIFRQYLLYLFYFGGPVLGLGLAGILFRSEKELKTTVATGVIVLAILAGIYLSYKKFPDPKISSYFGQSKIVFEYSSNVRKMNPNKKDSGVFAPRDFMFFHYFISGEVLNFPSSKRIGNDDYLLVQGIWPADIRSIEKELRPPKGGYISLGNDAFLFNKGLAEKILTLPIEKMPARGTIQKYLAYYNHQTTGLDKLLNLFYSRK